MPVCIYKNNAFLLQCTLRVGRVADSELFFICPIESGNYPTVLWFLILRLWENLAHIDAKRVKYLAGAHPGTKVQLTFVRIFAE